MTGMKRGCVSFAWFGALLGALGLSPAVAKSSELRFSETAAGGIAATGNALGLAKELNANGPGTSDSIGTFISLDETSFDDLPANAGNPWFAGTTSDWQENGAAAVLDLPDGAKVLYAELVWGGSTAYGSEDVTAFLNDPITLGSEGEEIAVTPDGSTALTLAETSQSGFAINYYLRSAEVTEFVRLHGAGTYTVAGVPATQDTPINQVSAAGWTLVVAYRHSGSRIRNLTIFVGGSFVDENAVEDYAFSGFCTPPAGPFAGSVVVSAIEGDANRDGDVLGIAASVSDAFVPLSGPNNPIDNFFASQVNGADGLVDTRGSFGELNHDAATGVNVVAGRQGWDLTQLAIGSAGGHLFNGQTEAVVRTETADDSYLPTLLTFAIEVNAPDFSGDAVSGTADPTSLEIQTTSTITIRLENTGLVTAEALAFTMPLPDGLVLESFAIDGTPGDIAGDPVEGAALTTGVDLGDVAPEASHELVIVVRAEGAPTEGDAFVLSPGWLYRYVSCVGEPPLAEPHQLADIVLTFVDEPVGVGTTGDTDTDTDSAGATSDSASASEDAASINLDDDGSATSSESGAPVSGSGTGGETNPSGCGCREGHAPATSGLAWLGLAACLRRRKRSR